MKWIDVEKDRPGYCENVAVLVKNLMSDGTECDYFEEYTGYISYRDRWLLKAPSSDRRGYRVANNKVCYWAKLPKHPKA